MKRSYWHEFILALYQNFTISTRLYWCKLSTVRSKKSDATFNAKREVSAHGLEWQRFCDSQIYKCNNGLRELVYGHVLGSRPLWIVVSNIEKARIPNRWGSITLNNIKYATHCCNDAEKFRVKSAKAVLWGCFLFVWEAFSYIRISKMILLEQCAYFVCDNTTGTYENVHYFKICETSAIRHEERFLLYSKFVKKFLKTGWWLS